MTDAVPPPEPSTPHVILPPGFLRNPVHLLAFGFGSGAAARAPGTWGSLAAIPVWLTFFWLPPVAYWLVVLLAFLVGIWLCGQTANALKVHDHGGIVWDEFVGMWIALGIFPDHVQEVLMAFILFRFFDVIKPWPISWLDKRMPGGLGIMVDDVVAGFMALGCLYLLELWGMPVML
ncbi:MULTISPECIES: phosphatidylglycerophosphatase A family protein [Marinobacter]|uniref:Phosphatidylglycerophosphatase A n=1 Tax=Marinobacter profundi TaxID=2666256 RepID=A0A2G1UHI0_9GAMM|nr:MULTISPECIES: phosphatidylglycerophosphatase A [Marinobacter]MBD3657687.1 phosphatidylglycerophosphatase A [Marinobacter sp.]PHQ13948.1 phosphatidylglycerophosphatase A [Marinobacter profundi]